MRVHTALLCATLSISGCAPSDATSVQPATDPATVTQLALKRTTQPPHCPPLTAAYRTSLQNGAERLADLQADQIGDNAGNGLDDRDPDDGGWDWTLPTTAEEHSADQSPINTYGSAALGAWSLSRAGLTSLRLQALLLDAGLGLQLRAAGTSSSDLLFLTLLTDAADNPGFAELARARYEASRSSAGGAQALGERQRDQRHNAAQDGLIAYDLAWLALVAAALDAAYPGNGFASDADTYAALLRADITSDTPRFDPTDTSEAFYTHGLAWSLVALSRVGDAPHLVARLRTRLLDLQHTDGAWAWNANYPNDNLQATAHALTALALTAPDQFRARVGMRHATTWLLRRQAADGGWDTADAIENPQVSAETLLALQFAQCLPNADTLEPHAAIADAVVATSNPLLRIGAAADMPPDAAPASLSN